MYQSSFHPYNLESFNQKNEFQTRELQRSNYSQNRKMKDPELITRYQFLCEKTATTKIDVT